MKINYDKGLLILENIEVRILYFNEFPNYFECKVVDLYYELYTCKFLYGKIKNDDSFIQLLAHFTFIPVTGKDNVHKISLLKELWA
jgi:hypothetical protein